ncbi:MAG: helix-hairpin-helix domain-containing protein [Chloroflexi bacterium]|nr:helix-hairpin-helix domain-containing protein [Chloroflexota bacterium]
MLKNWRPFLFGLSVGLLSVPLILVLNRRQTSIPIKLAPPPPTLTPVPLRIHVTGAVRAPGVYEMPAGSILQDVINTAGGLTEAASTGQLNLAQLLKDGEQVFIPELPPTLPPTSTSAPGQPTSTPAPQPTATTGGLGQLININTATQTELETLPRIGPSIAQRIIEYRNTNGPFNTIDEIKNVKGIGDSIFNAIAPLITVK